MIAINYSPTWEDVSLLFPPLFPTLSKGYAIPTRVASPRRRGLHQDVCGPPGSTAGLPCRPQRFSRAWEGGAGGDGVARWGRHGAARGEEGLTPVCFLSLRVSRITGRGERG